jgi:uncharacterized membrane protein
LTIKWSDLVVRIDDLFVFAYRFLDLFGALVLLLQSIQLVTLLKLVEVAVTIVTLYGLFKLVGIFVSHVQQAGESFLEILKELTHQVVRNFRVPAWLSIFIAVGVFITFLLMALKAEKIAEIILHIEKPALVVGFFAFGLWSLEMLTKLLSKPPPP